MCSCSSLALLRSIDVLLSRVGRARPGRSGTRCRHRRRRTFAADAGALTTGAGSAIAPFTPGGRDRANDIGDLGASVGTTSGRSGVEEGIMQHRIATFLVAAVLAA